jgi:hypothetical protein
MKHTGVVKRLFIGKASFKFEGASVKRGKGMLVASNLTLYTPHPAEGRLCQTNPIFGRPATIHHRGTEITEIVFQVSDQDCSSSFSVPSVSPWWRSLRNKANWAAVRRRASVLWERSYGAFGMEEAMEKRSQFPAARPFPSRGGLASFCTIDRSTVCRPHPRHYEPGFAFDVRRRRSLQ